MKKLVLFFAVAFAMSFASCGSKTAESTEAATDTAAVVVEEYIEKGDKTLSPFFMAKRNFSYFKIRIVKCRLIVEI